MSVPGSAIGLPSLVVVTDGQGSAGRPLLGVVAAAVEGGARAVLLREKHLPRDERLRLALEIAAILDPLGGLLLVASDPSIPAAGVHLAATDPFPDRPAGGGGGGALGAGGAPGGVEGQASGAALPGVAPPPPPPPPPASLVGRSCHSAADVGRAGAQGCSYATLSPIYPSASKPGYGPALGPAVLGGLALPTWALGGVDPTNARACLEAGAAGVAVMGEIMRSADPAATVAALLAALAGR